MNTDPHASETPGHAPWLGIAAVYTLAILGWLAVAVLTFRAALPVDLR